MYKFKRPETLPYPNIYYTFTAKDKHSDNILEYRVQDMPEKFFEQAVDFMVKYFLPDETFCASKNVPNKPSAVDSFRAFWLDSLQQKLSIACFRNDGNEELVGANVLIVNTKQDDAGDLSELEDQDVIDVFNALEYASKQFDIYDAFNVDKYLTAYGLCVNPEYRGRGIATEMLKARIPILKAFGLNVTATAFTGIGSQTAAKKAGFDDGYVISYSELEKVVPGFDFSKSLTKCYKTMVLRI